jgi:hypothetical protein
VVMLRVSSCREESDDKKMGSLDKITVQILFFYKIIFSMFLVFTMSIENKRPNYLTMT